MPRRVVLLVLPLLSLMSGCKALVRDAEVVEYRSGTLPITTAAKCDATYTLEVPENKRTSYNPVDVAKGETVGFRREPDGSLIAFAGTHTYTIPDQHAMWCFVPAPVTRWDRFVVSTRDKCENAFSTTLLVITAPIWMAQCAKTGVWP